MSVANRDRRFAFSNFIWSALEWHRAVAIIFCRRPYRLKLGEKSHQSTSCCHNTFTYPVKWFPNRNVIQHSNKVHGDKTRRIRETKKKNFKIDISHTFRNFQTNFNYGFSKSEDAFNVFNETAFTMAFFYFL